MSSEQIEDIIRKVYERYNKNPQGWRVVIGNDDKGYPTILFYSPEEVWELKLDSFYKPNPIVVASSQPTSKETEDSTLESPGYGFRPVDDRKARAIIESLKKKSLPSELVKNVLKKEPISLEEIRDERMVLHGPIIHAPKLPIISEQQVDLDIKLRTELQKLLMNRGIGSMYA
ncbi:MAG: hypothetical protein QXJ17_08575 [Nitrososphaeria archaeon]